MKNANLAAKKLSVLLKKLGAGTPSADLPDSSDPMAVLVMSFLIWESTTDKALAAYARIFEQVVDFNDLRVCLPHETLDLLGQRYPRGLDRAQRLRAVLKNIYLREHAVSLQSLKDGGKRDAKKYIESLEGIVPYVSSRVLLLSFDTHAMPVDDLLRTNLIEAEISDPSVEIPELSTWLASQVMAEEGASAHYALQGWIDDVSNAGERKAAGRAAASKKHESRRSPRGTARSAAG